MKLLANIFLALLYSITARGTGMPVFDAQELKNQLTDTLYFISSLETLMEEVGVNATDALALAELTSELRKYHEQVRLYDQLGGAIEDASTPSYTRSKILVDQINSVTRHIRKLKAVLALAKTIGARPGAINTSMQVLRDQRAREKEKYDIALKALEEREKVRRLRRELTRKIRIKEAIDREAQIIENFSRNTIVKPVQYSKAKPNSGNNDQLW